MKSLLLRKAFWLVIALVCLVLAISSGALLTTYYVLGLLTLLVFFWWSKNLGGPGNRRAFLMLRTGFFMAVGSFPVLLILYLFGVGKSGLTAVFLTLVALDLWGSIQVPRSKKKAWFFGVRVFALGMLGAITTWILFLLWWANLHWTFCPEPGCNLSQWFWLSLALTLGLLVLGLTGGLAYEEPDLLIGLRAFWVKRRARKQRGRRAKPIEIETAV